MHDKGSNLIDGNMFLGSIDDNVRRYLAGIAHVFNNRRVVVGCSGNFTSERIIQANASPSELHSNDVSLYTQLIADAILGNLTELRITRDEYIFAQPYVEDSSQWRRCAAIMVLMRLLAFHKRKSAHNKRMWKNYRENYDRLVAESTAQLQERVIEITSYFAGDVWEHFKRFEGEDVVYTSYLPFYKGGYERLYKDIMETVEWNEPTYPLIDDERRSEIIDWMRSDDREYVYILDYEVKDENPIMFGVKGMNRPVWLYSNVLDKTGVFRRKVHTGSNRFEILQEDYELKPDTQIGFTHISTSDIGYYKSIHLKKTMDFWHGDVGIAWHIDGMVFGFGELSKVTLSTTLEIQKQKIPTTKLFYMLSDFVIVRPHPKMAKLVIMLMLSNEVKTMIEHHFMIKTLGVFTTAFTDKPVSMKYRGAMQLLMRKEKDGVKSINYGALWSGKSIQEQYAEWRKRHWK